MQYTSSIHLSLENVIVHASHKELMKVLIVGISQGILDLQLWPHPVHFLNITIVIFTNYIKFLYY